MKLLLQVASVRIAVVFEPGTTRWGTALARTHGAYLVGGDTEADVELHVSESLGVAPEGWTIEARDDLRMVLSPDRRQAMMAPDPVMPPVDAVDRALRLIVADRIPADGGLLLHAAAARGETGITAFAGASGEGKSTVAKLVGVERLVADDTIALTRTASGWKAWPTPFMNLGIAAPAPGCEDLKQILVLQKSERDEVTPLRGIGAIKTILQHVMIGPAGADTERVLELVALLCGEVEVGLLRRTLDGDVERYLRAGDLSRPHPNPLPDPHPNPLPKGEGGGFALRLGELTWRVRLDARQELDDGFRVYLAGSETSGPELVLGTDDTLRNEPPDVPALEHQGGLVRFRGQGVRWQGELPLERVDARAAAEELVLHRALLPWMCTRMAVLGQGVLMHGALVRGRDGAWLLIGGADVGKSTACRLLGDRSLSTNISILRRVDGAWWAWTMPVIGENEPKSKEPGPFRVQGAIVLQRGEVAGTVEPVTALSARVAALGRAVVAQVPELPECTRFVVDSLTSLVSSCPVHRLAFRRDAIHLPE